MATNLIENVCGEPSRGLVLVCDALDRRYGLILATPGEQELGRLVQVKEEETRKEHDKGNRSQGEDQVSPAHVALFRAAGGTVGDRLASWETRIARISRNKPPRDQACYQVTNRPPDTQHGQEVSRCEGEEFQKKSPIHRQVTTDT